MTAVAFPVFGRRAVIYMLFDIRGELEPYVAYKLEKLRDYADYILVVFNGTLKPEARTALVGLVDDVLERENAGFDVGAYKTALAQIGPERLATFGELILMNYTWFGPVGSFDSIFDRSNQFEVDFWGVTDHGAVDPHPHVPDTVMAQHIQSHWIAVRPSLFNSNDWKSYWNNMPLITSYKQSTTEHESRFTKHFQDLGYHSEVLFPVENYDSLHPAVETPVLLLQQGNPLLKRRVFFHDPLYFDRYGVISKWALDEAVRQGYPVELIQSNMAKSAQPKYFNVNASMFSILPGAVIPPTKTATVVQNVTNEHKPRIAAVVHIFYEEMTDELMGYLDHLPAGYDLIITTASTQKAESIRETLSRRNMSLVTNVDIRVLPVNRGHDQSAFWIGSRDVLLNGKYELVVKIHSKKSPKVGLNAAEYFKRHQLENLLYREGYVQNIIKLFENEPGLGVVFPPMIHIGHPTLGGAWFGNQTGIAKLSQKLNIKVPLDSASPLAPLGSMFIARPEALRLLAEVNWTYEQFPEPENYADGELTHTLERAVTYAAGELGYHVRTVATTEHAALSHTFLEHKLDRIALADPGHGIHAIDLVNHLDPKLHYFHDRQQYLNQISELNNHLQKETENALALAADSMTKQLAAERRVLELETMLGLEPTEKILVNQARTTGLPQQLRRAKSLIRRILR